MKKILINREWKFEFGEHNDAINVCFDDSNWQDVGLPHSFDIPFFDTQHKFYVGYGTYRKHLYIDSQTLDKSNRIYLEFEAVFQDCKIYVNGQLVSTHKGGYTGFCVDITDFAKLGENIISVLVNNLWNPCLAPRAGEHIFCGGIYRDVSLIITKDIAVEWYGTYIYPIEITGQNAVVEIQTDIVSYKQRKAKLQSEIYYNNVKVGQVEKELELNVGQNKAPLQQIKIDNAHLWDIDEPNMYTMVSNIIVDDKVYESYTTPFGIRKAVFTADKGFFLNDKHLFMRGMNTHQDHAGWGDAVTRQGLTRDLEMIKNCGINAVRACTYPRHSHYYDESDRLGLLMWAELTYWGIGGVKGDGYWFASAYPMNDYEEKDFRDNLLQQLEEMIKMHRNHPSIVTWSLGNEIFFTPDSRVEKAKDFVKVLYKKAKELDPYRTISLGGVQRKNFDKLTDMAGYNGDGAKLFIDPKIANAVSEYGSVVSLRPGKFDGNFHECQNKEFPWRSGQFLWVAFHHGSICGRLANMGVVDYYRLPLRAYYWYRQEYLGIAPPPTGKWGFAKNIVVTCDKEEIKNDGTDCTHIIAKIINKKGEHIKSCPDITMEVVKGSGLFPTGNSITFSKKDENMLDGMCAIEMRSYYSGECVIKVSSKKLPPQYVTINVLGNDILNKQLVAMKKPPKQYGNNADSAFLISESRPTFASSNVKGKESYNINDGKNNTEWQPLATDKTSQVMVDLERFATINKVIVVADNIKSIECYTSNDSVRLKKIKGEYLINENKLVISKIKASCRYVVFQTKGNSINNVEIIGN